MCLATPLSMDLILREAATFRIDNDTASWIIKINLCLHFDI